MTVILIIVVKILSESYLTRTVYCNLKYLCTRAYWKDRRHRRSLRFRGARTRSASPRSAQADGGVVKCVLLHLTCLQVDVEEGQSLFLFGFAWMIIWQDFVHLGIFIKHLMLLSGGPSRLCLLLNCNVKAIKRYFS